MDGGRFRIEPWNGESENADATRRARGRFVGEGPFLWFVSFGPAKEMNSRDSAKGFDLDLRLSLQEASQRLSPEGELLSLLVQRK
jgi:hypothetical protein